MSRINWDLVFIQAPLCEEETTVYRSLNGQTIHVEYRDGRFVLTDEKGNEEYLDDHSFLRRFKEEKWKVISNWL